jgi:hypothetical protein
MNTARSIKLAVVSGLAGVTLLFGGLMIGGSIAGAQTPSPTPTAPSDATPQQGDDATPRGQRDGVECPKDSANSGSSSSSSTRGPNNGQGAGTGIRF